MQGKPYAPHEFSAPSQLAWADQHLAPAPLGAEPGGSVAGQIHDREIPALGPVEQRGVSATHFCRPMPHADGPDSQLISVSKQSRPAWVGFMSYMRKLLLPPGIVGNARHLRHLEMRPLGRQSRKTRWLGWGPRCWRKAQRRWCTSTGWPCTGRRPSSRSGRACKQRRRCSRTPRTR